MTMAETTRESAPFVARAMATDELIEAAAANDVVEFYRRQHGLTGTDVEWLVFDHPAVTQAPDSGDVADVLEALDEQFNSGIPLGIITAAMGKQGWTVGETIVALSELRLSGALWEPRDDHLRPV